MKSIIIRTLLLITSLLSLFSCTEDMNFKDVKVTPVKKLYTPAEGKQIQLLASTTASLFFEWEASKTEDSGSPLYEVVFDKEGGNFSNPIYRVPADNMGFRNYASISHKILNNIWGLAGIGAGDTGTLIWSVVASRGLNEVLALEAKSLSLTRLVGFEVLPDQLYITGEGSEAGTDISAAIACSSPVKGEFEIFTRLEAGKSYAFIDNKSQEARHFIIKDKKIIESQDEVLVEKSGIYKINLDFNLATITLNEVTNFGLFFCPDNKVTINMSYQGKGIWSG
ncbi:MAG: SusE domain-containing protein, partial [Bacteroidales bacterium]